MKTLLAEYRGVLCERKHPQGMVMKAMLPEMKGWVAANLGNNNNNNNNNDNNNNNNKSPDRNCTAIVLKDIGEKCLCCDIKPKKQKTKISSSSQDSKLYLYLRHKFHYTVKREHFQKITSRPIVRWRNGVQGGQLLLPTCSYSMNFFSRKNNTILSKHQHPL